MAITHEKTGLILANLVFGRELCLFCHLLFGALTDKERSTIDDAADLVSQTRDIQHYSGQRHNLANDGKKIHYDA
jgi:hypothetical protein